MCMKLYDIPENSKIRLLIGGEETREEVCTFHHVDGMYSYITTPGGHAVHLHCASPVKLVDGVYEVENELL